MIKKSTKILRISKLNWRRNIPPKQMPLTIMIMSTKKTSKILGQLTPTTLLCFSNSRYNGSSSKTFKRFKLREGLLSLNFNKLQHLKMNQPAEKKSKLRSKDGWLSSCLLKKRLPHYARISQSQSSRLQHLNRSLRP